jgi:hypothetical protein
MHLRYDDDFVEAAVFLCTSGRRPGAPSLQVRRFHCERECCYAVLDSDERNIAFFKVHLRWFREWGIEKLVLDVLDEYPLVKQGVNVLAFRQARSQGDEGAELFVHQEAEGGARSAVVAIRIQQFERNAMVTNFLRHEYMHLSDMLDPAYSYSPFLQTRGPSPAQQRITRERYRLLWDITIDGRLSHGDRAAVGTREHQRALFDRAYSFWPEERRQNAFDSLWNNPSPRHEEMLSLASDPRELSRTRGPLPGAACPLCGFPTFFWADLAALGHATLSSLQEHFPHWLPMEGVCARCVEVFQASGSADIPLTVCVG